MVGCTSRRLCLLQAYSLQFLRLAAANTIKEVVTKRCFHDKIIPGLMGAFIASKIVNMLGGSKRAGRTHSINLSAHDGAAMWHGS
jgi:hypothetical protein